MARSVVVVLNPVAIHELTHSVGGPVVRDLLIRGERVKVEAIRLAPKKTGNMARHIVKRLVEQNGRPVVLVGPTGVPYAIWVHEGAKPHVIRAVKAGALSFDWPKVGKMVAFKSVQHPGNKPNRFLVRALRVAA